MSSLKGSKVRLSTQRHRSVVKQMHARVHEFQTSKQSHDSLDSTNDANQQKRMISIQTAERIKAKKLALKKLREDPLEILDNLEKIVSNLQSIEDASEDEKKHLIALHKSLKKQQQVIKEEKAIEEESKVCPGPRIGVFFQPVKKEGRVVMQLLNNLQVGMKDVCFGLLCEKPGHEHIVPGKTKCLDMELGEELTQHLAPLRACGSKIVRNNICRSVRNNIISGKVGYGRLPDLGAEFMWDFRQLRAMTRMKKGMKNMKKLKEFAISSSEWFLKYNEIRGNNMKEAHGLHCIRYKASDDGKPPCYTNGSVAWLCKDHIDDGLKEGILESYSSKYHNIEDDYEIRYPLSLRDFTTTMM